MVDTVYAPPKFVANNQTCLDIISDALELATLYSGNSYRFYDNLGKLVLTNITSLKAPILVGGTTAGNTSLLKTYNYVTSIDDEVYNDIKIAQPDEDKGIAAVYQFRDPTNIGMWGRLLKYEQVDKNMTAAQVQNMGKVMLAYFNKKKRTLSVTAVGDLRVSAGMAVPLVIPDVQGDDINEWAMINEAKHDFSADGHEMVLTVEFGRAVAQNITDMNKGALEDYQDELKEKES
jgi:hypothetical protein